MTTEQMTRAIVTSVLWGAAAWGVVPVLSPVWDGLSRRYVRKLAARAETLGYSAKAVTLWLRLWGLMLLGAPFLVGYTLGFPVLALPVAGLVAYAPREVLGYCVARQERRLRDQMPQACTLLASKGRARVPLRRGLQEVADDLPDEPLRGEFRRLSHALQANHTLQDALMQTRTRLSLDSFSLFADLLIINNASGGDFPTALDGLSRALQNEQELERLFATQTSSGRSGVTLLGVGLVGWLLLGSVLDPDNFGLFRTTIVGQFALLGISTLALGSVAWARSVSSARH